MAAVIKCKVCEGGELKRKTAYRMSIPVVLIGYIFLIPSIIGMLIGIMGLVGTGKASGEVATAGSTQVTADLRSKNIPEPIITAIVEGKPVASIDTTGLTDQQKTVVESAVMTKQAATIGAGVGTAVAGGLSFGVIVMSFIGGLLGWLLVMKKKILKCNACGSIVAAS